MMCSRWGELLHNPFFSGGLSRVLSSWLFVRLSNPAMRWRKLLGVRFVEKKVGWGRIGWHKGPVEELPGTVEVIFTKCTNRLDQRGAGVSQNLVGIAADRKEAKTTISSERHSSPTWRCETSVSYGTENTHCLEDYVAKKVELCLDGKTKYVGEILLFWSS